MKIEITIDGATATGTYITWAPVHATIRLTVADDPVIPLDVVLRSQNAPGGGQVQFLDAMPGIAQDNLQLRLPANGTPVDFFVLGKYTKPSTDDRDAAVEVVEAGAAAGPVLLRVQLMVRIRKNANKLTAGERDRFISALAKLNNAGMGRFRDFRDMHRNISYFEAHGNMGFLPWHRAYLLDLERELQAIDPAVALPYWKFDETARNVFSLNFMGISNSIGTVQFAPSHPLQFWSTDGTRGVVRNPRFNTNISPARVISEAETLALGLPGDLFSNFTVMEGNPHGNAHTSFTGLLLDPGTAPRDPLFFLLHCNVDRLWAKWQQGSRRFDVTDVATYPNLGKANVDPNAILIGHNLQDSMWPWNGDIVPPRPNVAPGGSLAASPSVAAPGPSPIVGDMIDWQGVIDPAGQLGFDYDDVPFVF